MGYRQGVRLRFNPGGIDIQIYVYMGYRQGVLITERGDAHGDGL